MKRRRYVIIDPEAERNRVRKVRAAKPQPAVVSSTKGFPAGSAGGHVAIKVGKKTMYVRVYGPGSNS